MGDPVIITNLEELKGLSWDVTPGPFVGESDFGPTSVFTSRLSCGGTTATRTGEYTGKLSTDQRLMGDYLTQQKTRYAGQLKEGQGPLRVDLDTLNEAVVTEGRTVILS